MVPAKWKVTAAWQMKIRALKSKHCIEARCKIGGNLFAQKIIQRPLSPASVLRFYFLRNFFSPKNQWSSFSNIDQPTETTTSNSPTSDKTTSANIQSTISTQVNGQVRNSCKHLMFLLLILLLWGNVMVANIMISQLVFFTRIINPG